MNWVKLYACLLLSTASCSLRAQDLSLRALFEDAIESLRKDSQIVYIDSSISLWHQIQTFTKNGRMEGFVDLRAGTRTYMRVTNAELKEFDTKASRQPRVQWPSNLFTNGKMISPDSLSSFFTSYRRAFTTADSSIKYHYYYYISMPVIIRKNTVALFRLSSMIDHSSGYDYLFVYTREPSGWKRKMTIVAGAW